MNRRRYVAFAHRAALVATAAYAISGCSSNGVDADAQPGADSASVDGGSHPGPDAAVDAGIPPTRDAAIGSLPIVTVTDSAVGGVPEVSRALIGGNLRWPNKADGVLTAGGTLNSTTVDRALQLGLGSVRYPGGTVAEMFDWSHSAGETPTGCQTDAGFFGGAAASFTAFAPSASRYTIAQHAQFLSEAGQPITNLMIPMINQTPEDAVSFVLSVAQQTGQKDFIVEIGNEPFFSNQHYWRALDLSTRLDQYINGTDGFVQSAANQKDDTTESVDTGWHAIFRVDSCNLRGRASADGTADQRFRPRYVPINQAAESNIIINSDDNGVVTEWHYVGNLDNAGPAAHVFTVGHVASLGPGHNVFIFGDGTHGAKPNGQMFIALREGKAYTVGHQPGFNDFYAALKDLAGTQFVDHISVCSSWSHPSPGDASSPQLLAFVDDMADHKKPYDCMAVHTYNSISSASGAADYHNQLQAAAANLSRDLGKLQTAMRKDGHDDRFLEVTEYGSLNSPPGFGHTFLKTLYRARLVMGQVSHGVRVGSASNFNGLFADPDRNDHYILSSSGRMLSLWRRMAAHQPMKIHYCDASNSCAPPNIHILAARSDGGAGDAWRVMILNTGGAAWTPDWRFTGHSGESCLVIRRMRAALDTEDTASSTANDGALPSMDAVFIKKWHDYGDHVLADGHGDESRKVFPHSIELMSIVPVTAESQRCTIAPPFSMQ
ncbi:MAG TPA: hypothetical protein VFG83_16175 [Kofleriaceae bacterium]|nr:hypothetical protein [Kofleriaceae bacterium]